MLKKRKKGKPRHSKNMIPKKTRTSLEIQIKEENIKNLIFSNQNQSKKDIKEEKCSIEE